MQSGTNTRQITIPKNATKMMFKITSSYNGEGAGIHEIRVYSEPTVNVEQVYPIITEYGVEKGHEKIKINYFQTSVQKMYKIDDGDWQVYNDKIVRLELGKTLYAKGIDKYGIETSIVARTSSLASDALPIVCYDGIITQGSEGWYAQDRTKYGYMNVDDTMKGKDILITYYVNTVYNGVLVYFYDILGNEISNMSISNAKRY